MLEKKEFFCLSDGWLLSTLLIIRKGKLQLKDILTIGNILNHAFFTLEEVNNGLSRLESENYIELKDGKFSLTEKSKNFVKKNKKHFEGCIDRQVRYSRILSDVSGVTLGLKSHGLYDYLVEAIASIAYGCLLYTSPSPRD